MHFSERFSISISLFVRVAVARTILYTIGVTTDRTAAMQLRSLYSVHFVAPLGGKPTLCICWEFCIVDDEAEDAFEKKTDWRNEQTS